MAISRTPASPAWTITGGQPASASPNQPITFGAMTGGTGGTAAYVAIGTAETGNGEIFYFGSITPQVAITVGITPQISTSTTVTEL